MADLAPQVSPSFARTPQNPNISVPSEGSEPSQPQVPPSQPAAGAQPVDKLQEWLRILNNGNTQNNDAQTPPTQIPLTQTPPTQTTPAQPDSIQIPPAAFPSQQLAPEWAAQFSAMQQQNQRLQERLQQQDQIIQNLMQTQQDYTNLKNQVDASNIKFGDLATVENDDAKVIASGIMQAVNAQLEPIRQALLQQQQYTQKSNEWQEQRFAQQKAQDTLRRIIAKHPDFVALQSDPNYLNFVRQKDGASSLSYDALAAYEFQQGNADYIIDIINRYKNSANNSKDITTVAPVQTATAPTTPVDRPLELPTLGELNSWMQMRRITQDQYRALLEKVLAAQKG